MEGEQDVFLMPASDNYSTPTPGSRLQAGCSGSLPSEIHSLSNDLDCLTCTVARSRRPLSHSDLSKLQGILDNRSMKYHNGSSRPLIGRSNESGFFSDSPASSSSSIYHIDEMQRATLVEARATFPEQHEIDDFNQHDLVLFFNDFAEELGVCWKKTGRYLLKKECSVENIDADFSKVSEKAYQVLLKWKNENGAATSILDLFKCFNHIGREDVAEKVLGYLPKPIQNECWMILQSSPKKIRCPSMTTEIHNIKETAQEMNVVKQLRVAIDVEIHLCESKISGKKYIVKEVIQGPDNYILAARLAIPKKDLVTKKKQLRNTQEIKAKEENVNRLTEIVEQLQSKLKRDYFAFCKENVECTNCEKTKTKLELLEKESSLLHHTLDKISSDYRKLSITGIPTDKIYNLAERTYGICEDHKKMHAEIRKVKRRCSQEILDIEQNELEKQEKDEEGDDSEIEDTLECTMNILQHFARRRKVVQSLTPKRRKESKAVQRNKSDKSKSRSRFYVAVRDSFKYKKDSTAKPTQSSLTRTDSNCKKTNRSKDSKIVTRKKGCIEKPGFLLNSPTSTRAAALVQKNGNKTAFLGPEDLDLDDPNEAYIPSFRAENTRGRARASSSPHKKVHKCKSDPESRNMNQERWRDCHGEAVIDILTRKYYYERERSQSDAPIRRNRKPSRVHSARKRDMKRDMFLDKSRSHYLQDYLRDKASQKSQSAVSEASSRDKPSEKRDKCLVQNQSQSLEDSPSFKPSQPRDQLDGQSQSSPSIGEDRNNNQQETKSGDNVKWLEDIDTEDIIFV